MASPVNHFDLSFNPKPSSVIHIDLNSCFATVEQQANPFLRGRPIAVAAYNSPRGCILAPSIEAKKLGVRVGMRVKDGLRLCPDLQVLIPDPGKYRAIHHRLNRLLNRYSSRVFPKSIDEFVVDLTGFSSLNNGIFAVSQEIKLKIRQEIGEWLTVSIGIAPNRFLAKTASNLKKPDGLEEINRLNFLEVYSRLALTDLCGINHRLAERLCRGGILTVTQLFDSSPSRLKSVFRSVCGYYWYLRLRGWEVDDSISFRKSFSHIYSPPRPLVSARQLAPILSKLVVKTSARLRRHHYQARGLSLCLLYRRRNLWHQSISFDNPVFAPADFFRLAYQLLCQSPQSEPVATLSFSCFNLVSGAVFQDDLFTANSRKRSLVAAMDQINSAYGDFTIIPATMLKTANLAADSIGFGRL